MQACMRQVIPSSGKTTASVRAIGAMDHKEKYLESMKQKLDRIDARIDALKARAEQANAEQKAALEGRIAELEEQQSRLRARLAGMTTAAAWDDLKQGLDSAFGELSDAVEAAIDKFK